MQNVIFLIIQILYTIEITFFIKCNKNNKDGDASLKELISNITGRLLMDLLPKYLVSCYRTGVKWLKMKSIKSFLNVLLHIFYSFIFSDLPMAYIC